MRVTCYIVACILLCACSCSAAYFDHWWPWIHRYTSVAKTNAYSPDGTIVITNTDHMLYLTVNTGTVNAASNAWEWVETNSNGVNYVFSWTNHYPHWSNSCEWVTNNSNGLTIVLSWTNHYEEWSNAWEWVDANSNDVAYVFSWTNEYASWSNAEEWVSVWSNIWETNASGDVYVTNRFVGIGTNDPASMLEVNGALTVDGPSTNIGGIRTESVEARQSDGAAYALTLTGGEPAGMYAGVGGNVLLKGGEANGAHQGGNVVVEGGDGTGNGDFIVRNEDASITNLIVKDTGNVGVGTNSPGEPLHVAGTILGDAIVGGLCYEGSYTLAFTGGYWTVTNFTVCTSNNIGYASHSNLTTSLSGYYDIYLQLAFDGTGGAVTYEMAAFTNGVEVDSIESRIKAANVTDTVNLSAGNILYLPSGVSVDMRIREDDESAGSISPRKAQLKMHRVN